MPNDAAVLEIHDLRRLPEDDCAKRKIELTREFFDLPFSLQTGLLLRAQLVLINNNAFEFSLCIHHIAFDGWSTRTFYRDLSDAYKARSQPDQFGDMDPYHDIELNSYVELAIWEDQFARTPEFERQLGYWMTRLGGYVKGGPLPIHGGNTPITGNSIVDYSPAKLSLDSVLTDKLVAFAREKRLTRSSVFLAAICAMHYRYSQELDQLIGVAVANRSVPEFEEMVGCFVNIVAVRSEISHDVGFETLVRTVQQSSFAAFEHQSVPFEKVIEVLKPVRRDPGNPLIRTMFFYQPSRDGSLHLDGANLRSRNLVQQQSEVDLTFSCWESDGEIDIHVAFDTDLYNIAAVHRYLRDFVSLLEGGIDSPETRIDELKLFGR